MLERMQKTQESIHVFADKLKTFVNVDWVFSGVGGLHCFMLSSKDFFISGHGRYVYHKKRNILN